MDAINLQGLWPNFAGAGVVPPAPAVRRTHGLGNYDWKTALASYLKAEEDREEAAREVLRKQLEKVIGKKRAAEYLERYARAEAERVEAEDQECVLMAALTGDDYE